MAAVSQPISPAARQPFRVLGDTRLRAVESMKNKQNGLTTNTKSLKRRFDDSSLSDSENVDPLMITSPTKKPRNQMNQGIRKPAGNINLFTKPNRLETPVKQILQTSPFTRPTSISASRSAPIRGAVAGRFPKPKAFKPFARRSLGAGTPSKARPLGSVDRQTPQTGRSIDAPLADKSSRSKSKLAPVSGVPSKKSWNFEIYVDTEQEEMANLMEHSTSTLDISDDESSVSPKDDRGKENIPPDGLSDSIVSATSINAPRTAGLSDESREPLGELNPGDFVPEGVDPSEAILVLEEQPVAGSPPKKARSPLSITEAVDEPAEQTNQPNILSPKAISNIISNATPPSKDSITHNTASADDLAIWESGSSTEDSADC